MEACAANGGVFVLTAGEAQAGYRDRATLCRIEYRVAPTRRFRSGMKGLLIGAAIATALALVFFLENPLQGPSGHQFVFEVFLGCGFPCLAPPGGAIGFAVGYRFPRSTPFVATFEGLSLAIDGRAMGRLESVESDPVDATLTLVSEQGQRTIRLGSSNDAVRLAAAIEELVFTDSPA